MAEDAAAAFGALKEFIPTGKHNRPGTKMSPAYITIHNTDNDNKGAGAKAHSKFVRETGYYIYKGEKHWVSWHFTVDDTYVIQHLPLDEVSYHAGTAANTTSLAIEICMNSDIDEAAANDKAAALVASLLTQFSWNTSRIRKHKFWTGKNCPSQLMTPAKWNAFIASIESKMQGKPLVALELPEARSAGDNHRIPEDVEDFEIDHHLLSNAINGLTDGTEVPAERGVGEVFTEIITSLSHARRLDEGTPRMFFPQGINEIQLSLKPRDISVTVRGPISAGSREMAAPLTGADEPERSRESDPKAGDR